VTGVHARAKLTKRGNVRLTVDKRTAAVLRAFMGHMMVGPDDGPRGNLDAIWRELKKVHLPAEHAALMTVADRDARVWFKSWPAGTP
jgi:hypothetical protein